MASTLSDEEFAKQIGAVPVASTETAAPKVSDEEFAKQIGAVPVPSAATASVPSTPSTPSTPTAANTSPPSSMNDEEFAKSIGAVPVREQPEQNLQQDQLKEENKITPEEIQALARKHGVDPKELESLTPYLGAYVGEADGQDPGLIQAAKKGVGVLSSAVFDLPIFAAKKTASPEMERAMDEVRELAKSRRTDARRFTEGGLGLVAGFGPMTGVSKGLEAAGLVKEGYSWTRAAVEGAAYGVAAGLGRSKQGEELESAVEEGAAGFGGGVLIKFLGATGKFAYSKVKQMVGPAAEKQVTRAMEVITEFRQQPEVVKEEAAGAIRAVRLAKGEELASLKSAVDETAADIIQKIKSNPEELERLVTENPDLVKQKTLGNWSEERFHAALAQSEARNAAEQDLIHFAGYLKSEGRDLSSVPASADKARDIIQQWYKEVRSEQQLGRQYDAYRFSQAAFHVNDSYVRHETTAMTKIGRMFLRGRGQMGIIDDRSGTTLQPLIDKWAGVKAQELRESGALIAATSDVRVLLEKTGLTKLGAEELAQLEKGDSSFLSKAQSEGLSLFKETMEDLRKRVNAKWGEEVIPAIDPKKAALYIPKMQVDPATTSARIQGAAEKLGIQVGEEVTDAFLSQLKAQKPQELASFLDQLGWTSGKTVETGRDIRNILREVSSPQGVEQLASRKINQQVAGARQQRMEDGLPDSLRETNLNSLMVRWQAQTLRDFHQREVLVDGVKQLNALLSSGDRAGADYLQDFLASMTGGRKGVAGYLASRKIQNNATLLLKAERAAAQGDQKKAQWYRDYAQNGDLMGILSSTMYTNIMGFRPKSAITALTAPVTTMFPELASGGTGWAAAKTMRAYSNAFAAMSTAPKDTFREVLDKGWVNTHMQQEYMDAMVTGLESSGFWRGTKQKVQSLATVGLSMVQASEIFNRVVAKHAADDISHELVNGGEQAKAFVNQMAVGYKYLIGQALKKNDAQEVNRIVREYMMGKTMMHESSVHMSEIGRSFGPIAGAFSAWPSTVAADVIQDMLSKPKMQAATSLFRKYVAPLGVAMTIDHILDESGMGPKDQPLAKTLIGTKGVTSIAPITSVSDVLGTGAIPIRTPYSEAIFKNVAAAVSGDPGKMGAAASGTAQVFVPGAGILRAINTTAPGLLNQPPLWEEDE